MRAIALLLPFRFRLVAAAGSGRIGLGQHHATRDLPMFKTVYRRPGGADETEVHGTPAQVREQLEALVAAGANHLLVNPTGRYTEQVEALAEVVGLS